MKTLIIILIIVSFIQATILPIDLVLIILICRSYLIPDKNNLFLAFAFGLLLGYLNLTTLGFASLSYLTSVVIVEGLSRSRLASNAFLIIPLTFVLLLANQAISFYFTHQAFQLLKVFLESFVSLPIFYLVKGWEERFTVRREIKLRV